MKVCNHVERVVRKDFDYILVYNKDNVLQMITCVRGHFDIDPTRRPCRVEDAASAFKVLPGFKEVKAWIEDRCHVKKFYEHDDQKNVRMVV